MNSCLECNSETLNAKFCSLSCAARMNGRLYPKRKRQYSERMCGACRIVKPIELMKGRTCLDCRREIDEKKLTFLKTTIGEFKRRCQKAGLHRSWWYSEVRAAARRLNKHRPRKCQVCSYDAVVEFAHIKGLATFSDDATIEEINRESNIAILCPNHHWELDHGLIEPPT